MSDLIIPQDRELVPLRFAQERGFHLSYVTDNRYLYLAQDWVAGLLAYTYKKPSKAWDKLRRIAENNHGIDLRDYTVKLRYQPPYTRYRTVMDFATVDGLVSITQCFPYNRKDIIASFMTALDEQWEWGSSALKSAGYVYLFYAPSENLYKIGHSISAKQRFTDLQTICPCEIQHVWDCYSENRFTLEKQFHERYASKRHHGEWFNLSPDDVAAITAIH